MELNDFIKNFAEQFDETDASEFKADTVYRDLDEWSSMSGLAIIAMVDDCYGKTVTSADFKNSVTIEDLFNIVCAK